MERSDQRSRYIGYLSPESLFCQLLTTIARGHVGCDVPSGRVRD